MRLVLTFLYDIILGIKNNVERLHKIYNAVISRDEEICDLTLDINHPKQSSMTKYWEVGQRDNHVG